MFIHTFFKFEGYSHVGKKILSFQNNNKRLRLHEFRNRIAVSASVGLFRPTSAKTIKPKMPGSSLEKVRRYENIGFLGEGQFATVYKANDTEFNKDKGEDAVAASAGGIDPDAIVAVKKIKLGSRAEAKDGINRTALREIKLLQELSHDNIISLRDVFGYQSSISLVMDFMDTDLEVIIKDTTLVLAPANIKSYVLQTFLGLEYLHNNWVLHRDLKPNNLLVNRKGIVKITDFGLAKAYGSPNRQYTHLVVTRWYRAPELLFGARIYGTGIDIWAMGCILAELLLRVPFVAGETDLDQLAKIFQALGTPTQETWPDHTTLPDFVTFKSFPGTPLQDIFIAAGPDLIQLLERLLAMDPNKRCNATEALKMPYFSNRPFPSRGEDLPLPASFREEAAGDAEGGAVRAGAKRKIREGLVESGLAKKLVF